MGTLPGFLRPPERRKTVIGLFAENLPDQAGHLLPALELLLFLYFIF
jgi:hypothetical protein